MYLYSELQGEKKKTWKKNWFLLLLKCIHFIETVNQQRAFLRLFQNVTAVDLLNIGWKYKRNLKSEAGIRNVVVCHSTMKF